MTEHIFHFLRDIPIKRKLMIIIMLITSVALLAACVTILIYERKAYRDAIARDFAIIADTFDDNVASGLAFHDPESIVQTLSTLKANPNILAACVYDEVGNLVAEYQRADLQGSFVFPELQMTGQEFLADRLDTFQGINLDGEIIGTFYIASDLTAISRRLKRSGLIIISVVSGALLLSFILSTSLQKFISEPISHLANIARMVATKNDYSIRAVKQSEDELGGLIDTFNDMLNQIQLQDSALHLARSQLEKRVLERTQELAKSVSLLNATLDSTADGIIAIQFTDEALCYNSQFVEMWKIPPHLLKTPSRNELLGFIAQQTANPQLFLKQTEAFEPTSTTEAFDVIKVTGGQIFERYIKPQKVEGKIVGLVINFRDITSRKQAETELAEANSRLFATSRQAGMAEVATSILHNVGNVLNSVSVSAEVVSTKVRQFRIGSLKNLSDLLEQHSNDLTRFLTEDPRGKELPAYLLKLVSHLAEPQKGILEELESLRKNIEHIKEIVAMQQGYARGSGVMELLSINELIEDAIRINAAGFSRHELTLIRDIRIEDPVLTDRHKVLQILVNLLGNAKYALSNIRAEKQLIVRVTRSGNGTIQINIIDNGIGIAPENLTKIFQHGFTTKKDGHGFGLHSGAIAARELGGKLTAYSAGLDQGATFTLELPFPSTQDSSKDPL